MAGSIPLPVEGGEHLVEPPILDFLHRDPTRRAYVVTFVPEDVVSNAETEIVEIPENTSDGQRIALQLETLAHLLKVAARVERIVHSGGGDFEFHFDGEKARSLSSEIPSPDAIHDVYRCLQDVSMTAQVVFILRRRAQQPAAT